MVYSSYSIRCIICDDALGSFFYICTIIMRFYSLKYQNNLMAPNASIMLDVLVFALQR